MSKIKETPDGEYAWAGDKITKLVFPNNPRAMGSAYDEAEIVNEAEVTTNGMTREELTARLELVEAKGDARLSRFEERMDQAIGEMRRDTGRFEASIESFKSTTDANIHGLKASMEAGNASVKTTMITSAVGAVLAIVLGVAAFNATVLSNMVASFESGQSTATAVGEATSRLEALQDRIEAQQKQAARLPLEKN